MRPANYRRVPRQNTNAPTPSTRLLPSTQLKFFELKPPANALPQGPVKDPVPRPDGPSACDFRVLPGFLSWPGLLLERTERLRTRTSPTVPRGASRERSGKPKEALEQMPGSRGNGSVEQPG